MIVSLARGTQTLWGGTTSREVTTMHTRLLLSALVPVALATSLACDPESAPPPDDSKPSDSAGGDDDDDSGGGGDDDDDDTTEDESDPPEPGGCNDIGCNGGFFLRIKFDGGSADGTYTITLDAEDNIHTASCVIDDARGECSSMEPDEGNSVAFVTYVELAPNA